MDAENVELDFKHLIKCALNHEISWPALRVVLESATTTLKKSKKLNNILLEELESIQFEQTRNKTKDETHAMSEHEPLEKDVDFSIHNTAQNCENDNGFHPRIEFEEYNSGAVHL